MATSIKPSWVNSTPYNADGVINPYEKTYLDAGKYYKAPSSSDSYAGKNYFPSPSVGKRSALDRMFDMLLVGQYAVQGGIHGALDPNQTWYQGVGEGLKASNPFGDGNVDGEYNMSKNLDLMGWKPETKLGKFARGAVGFVGDVALDPLTYINPLSVGGSAIFKGTGQKVGKEVIEKFTPDMAEKILKQTTGAIPKSEDVIDLVRRVNEKRGIVEAGKGKGFGLYGSNIPFADKLGIADKKLEFASEASLRAFGDNTFAPFINKLSDSLLHSKAGKMFSTKADLLDLARKEPEALAMGFEFARKAGKANLSYKDALVELKDEYKKLKDLTPQAQQQITNILEDTKLWDKFSTFKPLDSVDKVKEHKDFIEKAVKEYGMENKDLAKIMEDITPKYNPGENAVLRFKKVGDTDVVIEGIAGKNPISGERYYKIKGYDKAIPESNFVPKAEIEAKARETYRKAQIDHILKERESTQAGRINLSEVAIGVDTKGQPIVNKLDEAINKQEIKPSIPDNKDLAPIQSKVANLKDELSKSQQAIQAHQARLAELDKMPIAKAKSEIIATNQLIKEERSKMEKLGRELEYHNSKLPPQISEDSKNLALNESSVDMSRGVDNLPEHLTSADGTKTEIVNHHIKQPKYQDKKGKWITKGTHRLSNNISIEKNGNIVNHTTGEYFGESVTRGGKIPNSTKPLANITNVKGIRIGNWNKTKTEGEAEIRSFFKILIEKDPVLKDAFEHTIKTGQLNEAKSVESLTKFIDSYYTRPTYEVVDGLHRFNKNYKDVTEILTKEFGDYKTLSVEAKKVRMERMYELYNNPKKLQELKASISHDKYATTGAFDKGFKTGYDASIDNTNKMMDITNNEIYNKSQAENGKHGYALADERAMDKSVETMDKSYNLYSENGEWQGVAVASHVAGKEVTQVEYKGNIVSIKDLEKHGFNLLEKAPTKVTGERTIYPGVSDEVAMAYEKHAQQSAIDKRLNDPQFLAQKEKGLAYIFDEPLVKPKTAQELNDEAVNAVGNDAEEKLNKATINEAVESMKAEVKGRKPKQYTVEDAINDLPNELNLVSDVQARIAENYARKIEMYTKALSSEAEFERYAKTIWKGKAWDKIMKEREVVTHAIETTDLYDVDIIKIAKDIRGKFKSVKDMEVAIGKLDTVLNEGYVAHVLNPAFVSPLEKLSQEELDDMGIKIPKNDFNKKRQYKKGTIMPNGYKLKEGTVAEINREYMNFAKDLNQKLIAQGKDPIEVQKMFLDEISDIYVDRLSKHYKLMYDSTVFGDITKKFGTQYGGKGKPIEYADGMDAFLRGDLENTSSDMYNVLDEIAGGIDSSTLKEMNKDNVTHGSTVIKKNHSLVVSTDEIKKAFKGMDAETRTKYLEQYKLTEDEFSKLGNSFIRVDKEVADKVNLNGHSNVHQVPNSILDKAESLAHVQMGEDVNGLLGAYDKFLRNYKLMVTAYRPAFHMNNIKGNAFNNYLDVGSRAFSPRLNKASIEALQKKEGSIVLGGKTFSYKELYDELTVQGKIGSGFFGKDVKVQLQEDLINKNSPLKTAFQKPQRLGSAIEDQGKMVNFMANLDLGKSFTEAGEHVDKFLFDYGDITKFEHQVMQRVFPFYTWMRKNAPLQLEQMFTNPKRYMPVAKALGEMKGMLDDNERIDMNKVPAFARDWVQLPFNITNENGNQEALMWSNNLPYMDVNKIPDIFNPKDSAVNLLENSSPAIKMPIELGTNYNYFFDRPIDKGKKVVDPSGQFEVSPKLAYVLSQIPQYAEPGGVVRKQGLDRLIHIMDKGLSSGVKSYDNASYGGSTVAHTKQLDAQGSNTYAKPKDNYYGEPSYTEEEKKTYNITDINKPQPTQDEINKFVDGVFINQK